MSPILCAVYIDPLITLLKNSGLRCMLRGDFYECLVYADDILLLTHTVHSMQIMLHICDKFTENFDIKCNAESRWLCVMAVGMAKMCCTASCWQGYFLL